MLNLVPFAGSWRQMTYAYGQIRLVCKFLKLRFPKANSVSVAAAAIGGDQQLLCLRVGLLTHRTIPRPYALDGESGRIVVGANTDPCRVVGDIVYPVRGGLAQFGDQKVMNAHLLGVTLGPQLAPPV